MNNKLAKVGKKILFFLIFLYPILPVNYYIGVFNYSNLCSMLIVATYIFSTGRIKRIRFSKYNLGFWQYLFIYSVFAIFSAGLTTGVASIVSTIMVSMVIILVIKDENDFSKIINLIIISAFFLGILGGIESLSGRYLIQGKLLDMSDGVRYGILRCSGPFGHPINFGIYQTISSILAFYMLNTEIKRRRKKLYMLAYIVSSISVFLSVSRLVICMFLAINIILLFKMGFGKFVKYTFIAILIGVCGLTLFNAIGLGIDNLINDFLTSLFDMLGIGKKNITTETIGFGNRFDLYSWVISSVGDKWLFGLGIGKEFAYQMTDWFTKTSIEVHYLYIYYQCGIVGLISLIISYVSSYIFFHRKNKYKLEGEKKLSFLSVLLTILIVYYISLFGVQETDMTRMYCEIISLGIAYLRIQNQKAVIVKRESMLY